MKEIFDKEMVDYLYPKAERFISNISELLK